MIYGRFGQALTILRVATEADVRQIEGRKLNKTDREALASGSYVVVAEEESERLYHQAFLRADGGSVEITRALEALIP